MPRPTNDVLATEPRTSQNFSNRRLVEAFNDSEYGNARMLHLEFLTAPKKLKLRFIYLVKDDPRVSKVVDSKNRPRIHIEVLEFEHA